MDGAWGSALCQPGSVLSLWDNRGSQAFILSTSGIKPLVWRHTCLVPLPVFTNKISIKCIAHDCSSVAFISAAYRGSNSWSASVPAHAQRVFCCHPFVSTVSECRKYCSVAEGDKHSLSVELEWFWPIKQVSCFQIFLPMFLFHQFLPAKRSCTKSVESSGRNIDLTRLRLVFYHPISASSGQLIFPRADKRWHDMSKSGFCWASWDSSRVWQYGTWGVRGKSFLWLWHHGVYCFPFASAVHSNCYGSKWVNSSLKLVQQQ